MQTANNSSLDITQLYFKLSNAGDLSAIETLMIPEATYSSSHTGLYYGITDIMSMMKSFFASYQSLNWQIDGIIPLTEHITEVQFTCQSIDKSGQSHQRSGVERLVVVDGLIRHIEVV